MFFQFLGDWWLYLRESGQQRPGARRTKTRHPFGGHHTRNTSGTPSCELIAQPFKLHGLDEAATTTNPVGALEKHLSPTVHSHSRGSVSRHGLTESGPSRKVFRSVSPIPHPSSRCEDWGGIRKLISGKFVWFFQYHGQPTMVLGGRGTSFSSRRHRPWLHARVAG
jgi:hypothetical protein